MCEDFPCCDHGQGYCPDYDEAGRQLNMKCTCGAVLPVKSRSSICSTCIAEGNEEDEMRQDMFNDSHGYGSKVKTI